MGSANNLAHFFDNCFVCGYLASLAVPRSKKSIQGLTIHTLQRSDIL